MIVQISQDNLKDVNKSNEVFEVIGRIIPRYEDDIWTYTEELFSETYEKQYPFDDEDYEKYINNKDKTIFFFYENGLCLGQVKLHKRWGEYAFLDDLFVSQNARGKGIGQALVRQAAQWAMQNQLKGLMLETQDNNLRACRFYTKCGFKIGGVDNMIYSNYPEIAHEKAVYWYLKW